MVSMAAAAAWFREASRHDFCLPYQRHEPKSGRKGLPADVVTSDAAQRAILKQLERLTSAVESMERRLNTLELVQPHEPTLLPATGQSDALHGHARP
jgi:hypothetical protein